MFDEINLERPEPDQVQGSGTSAEIPGRTGSDIPVTPSIIKKMSENLENAVARTRSALQSLMAIHQPGDLIISPDHKESLQNLLTNPDQPEGEEDLTALISASLDHIITINILIENGFAEESPEGVRMIRHGDPDEMVIERALVLPEEINGDLFLKHGINLVRHLEYSTGVILAIDPRIHFTCDPEKVEEQLEGLEVDDESADQLVSNLHDMNLIIHLVLDIVGERQVVSLPELASILGDFKPELPAEQYTKVMIHTSPLFIEELVNDLIKLRLIRGNNTAIRMVK